MTPPRNGHPFQVEQELERAKGELRRLETTLRYRYTDFDRVEGLHAAQALIVQGLQRAVDILQNGADR